MQERRSLRPRDFWARGVLRPFLIALALMFFLQFTGINIILNNTPNIFRLAGSTIHASLATIIVGVALLLSNTLTVIVADKMPRRIMLLLSGTSTLCEVFKAQNDQAIPINLAKLICGQYTF